jgi:hypothetical protein
MASSKRSPIDLLLPLAPDHDRHRATCLVIVGRSPESVRFRAVTGVLVAATTAAGPAHVGDIKP